MVAVLFVGIRNEECQLLPVLHTVFLRENKNDHPNSLKMYIKTDQIGNPEYSYVMRVA